MIKLTIQRILRTYLLTFFLLNIVVFFLKPEVIFDSMKYTIANISIGLTYYLLLSYFTRGEKKLNKTLVFSYITIAIAFLNILFYSYGSSFFEFNAADSYTYDNHANFMISRSLSDGINWMIVNIPYDDWGHILYVSTIYRLFAPHNLIVNFINIIMAIVTLNYLYKLMLGYFPKPIALVLGVAFIASSFSLYFQAGGLKELFMVWVMTMIAYYHYKLTVLRTQKRLVTLITLILLIILLLIYRPIVIAFILIAILLSEGSKRGTNIRTLLVFVVAIGLGIALLDELTSWFDYYLRNASMTIEMSEYGSNKPLTWVLGILAGVIGPLPTFYFSGKENVFLYSTGLLFRVILSGYFLLGLYTIYRKKIKSAYFIFFFTLLEMISLIGIQESFELRLSMPHFPFIYLISGIGIYNTSSNAMVNHSRMFMRYYFTFLIVVILIWNYR